jgi:Rrf2 family transcriptional regulator, iron-sulfur cluster assembly transcription factor
MGQKYFSKARANMTILKNHDDINQVVKRTLRVHLFMMIFSKSFGYALRGILYIALSSDTKSRVHLDEIAERLSLPRHFLGKVLKKVSKEGILGSTKGPHGGFYLNDATLQTPLIKLIEITSEAELFDSCVLRFRKCNSNNPCPLHYQIESIKKEWHDILAGTKVGDLLKNDTPDFIKSISTL